MKLIILYFIVLTEGIQTDKGTYSYQVEDNNKVRYTCFSSAIKHPGDTMYYAPKR